MLLNTGDKEKRICIEKGKIGINSINILVIFSITKFFTKSNITLVCDCATDFEYKVIKMKSEKVFNTGDKEKDIRRGGKDRHQFYKYF
jgi:hypothetical protein